MIPFSPPRIDQRIIDEVTDTLRSGWITTGPKTKRFEKNLTAYCGSKATLCLNSATAGLELMLRWFGVGEGDEVIVPAYTYSATANVVQHCKAKVVFVDVADDFNIDVRKIESAITDRTKVVMPVDFGGMPCDYKSIHSLVSSQAIVQKFKPANEIQKNLGRILILSDAAHSFGASVNQSKTGSLTDVSVFSFHAVKNLTTAEGGAVALNLPEPFDNEEIYRTLCIKSLHGQNKDALAKTQKGNWKYDIVEAGYKMNMTDLQASFGLVELERYDEDTLVRRKKICQLYTEELRKHSWAIFPIFEIEKKSGRVSSSYHLYPLRIKGINEEQRNEIMQKIFDRNVSVNVHFIPVPMMSYYQSLGYNVFDYPNTWRLYESEISLPVYYDLSDEDASIVLQALVESVNEVLQPA